MLEVRELGYKYNHSQRPVQALERVDFTAQPGESWAVIGPSGCGKSTLLYLLAGLLKPTYGEISFHGREPEQFRHEIALILQGYGLFPWKTVLDNITLGLRIRRVPRGEARERAQAIMEELGIGDLAEAYPRELSGGQKQRVAIARSLVLQPKLLLMDEPFSALDALTREKMQNLLLKIWQERTLITILVTHSIEEAVILGRKIMLLSSLPGRLLEVVDNPGMGSPGYRSTTEYLDLANYLRKRLEETNAL
ncbi:MAG: ABC transporter ATP-binding protein [Firmicutes bacterium]|nr:ABC transporter ATP-binding protein [Bacillota bacterium]